MGESEQPCVQVLLADPDMECYKGDHIVVMIIGGLGLLVYTFGHGTAIARHLALWPRTLLGLCCGALDISAWSVPAQVSAAHHHGSSANPSHASAHGYPAPSSVRLLLRKVTAPFVRLYAF